MDPFRVEQTAQQLVDPGETLIWCGAPDPARTAFQTIPLALIGVPSAGFAVFWMVTASRLTSSATGATGAWRLFPLFGVPFLLIGLATIFAPLWTFFGARRTVYGITNRRIFIAGAGGKSVRSFSKDDIGDLEHVERSDGTGDLYFALRTVRRSRGVEFRRRIGFIGIRDVRHVEATLREQLESQAA